MSETLNAVNQLKKNSVNQDRKGKVTCETANLKKLPLARVTALYDMVLKL